MNNEMNEVALEEDLKTTSAQVSASAKRLDALEATKRELDAGDPRRIELSDEIERLAASLRRQAAIEGDLARELHEAATGEPA